MPSASPVAVVEMAEFVAASRKMLDDDEREELIDFLASNPTAGDVIAGSGGVRKLRWALPGRGKSGGARVIYYYHDERIPLFLLDAFAKSDQANISHAKRNAFRKVVAAITAAVKEQGK
jgi:hypothetical protein